MKKKPGVKNNISGKGLKIGMVASRFNEAITESLVEGATRILQQKDVAKVDVVWVPGAFEIPLALQKLAGTRRYHALIALGAVIRGETPHFDYVAGECSRGIMKVMLEQKIPIAFGILTTNTMNQALDRIGGKHGHKGEEAALVAIEMGNLIRG